MRGFAHVAARALLPEQQAGYVAAVTGTRPWLCGDCLAYDGEGQRVLVAYPPVDSPEALRAWPAARLESFVRRAVAAALADGYRGRFVALAPVRPDNAPPEAVTRRDAYAFLPLPPPPPGVKLRNMLRRGGRECRVAVERWGAEHSALAAAFSRDRPLPEGARHIFRQVGAYLAACPEALLFAARRHADGLLLALAVGDYASLATACYMFAFRRADCPPGVADALLAAVVNEAGRRGHERVNLGLDIHPGIAAFKRKWRPDQSVPYAETAWEADPARMRPAPPPAGDPLSAFAAPGLAGRLRTALLGSRRDLDCLQVEVTSHCPGRCSYCPHTLKKAVWQTRHMEAATFAALAGLARRARRVHLQGWGEPLAHPRFFDFAAAARRVGCAVSTTTCGLAVDDDMARRLVAAGLDLVAFSLTGVDAAGNAARRGIPLERVAAGIDALNRARRRAGSATPRVHLAYLLLASQTDQVAGLPDFMARHNVSVAVVSTLDYLAEPGMAAEAYAPGDAGKIGRVLPLLRAAALRAAAEGRAVSYGLPGARPLPQCAERVRTCCYVDAAGVMAPCVYLNPPTGEDDPRRVTYGSILERPAEAIWMSPACRRFRERALPSDGNALCAACPKRFVRLGAEDAPGA